MVPMNLILEVATAMYLLNAFTQKVINTKMQLKHLASDSENVGNAPAAHSTIEGVYSG
jgi:hypothetical protein